ncbi:reverse transcriptase [Phytophthora megakarya]|uniref:Reverse transcriptase n=1 Tax=Phytophthora megakarya TaxID=4795 RepID=A0A225WG38_9STRA|nr:reverse transcriptase [Phytophthora megakarya]
MTIQMRAASWVDCKTGKDRPTIQGKSLGNIIATQLRHAVAESYEDAVFRRFGNSQAICHGREPGFMSSLFIAFNKLTGERQRVTLAPFTRAIMVYTADVDQRDWDEYSERRTYALNHPRSHAG